MGAGSLVAGLLLAALCPAGGIKVMHGPESTKPASPPDTYKLAKLTDNAWKAYGARTAPYAVTLPPV